MAHREAASPWSSGSAPFIQTVDGKDVATLDTAFEVLPGCHVVRTASHVLIANEVMVWNGDLGSRTFALRMRPGNTYIVKLEMVQGMGMSADARIYAIEQNAAGQEVQQAPPVIARRPDPRRRRRRGGPRSTSPSARPSGACAR